MAKSTEKKVPEETSEPTKPPRKKTPLILRFFIFLLTLALALGAVALVAFRGDFNLDTLARYISYRDLERSDSGQAEAFSIEHGSATSYGDLDDDLLVVSNIGSSLYSFSGVEYLNQSSLMSQPVLTVNGDYAVVYDAGGYTLRVIGQRNIDFSLDMSLGNELLSARITPSGQLVVTTCDASFKGVTTVYDKSYQPYVSYHLSSSFPMDALLSDDGKCLALLTVGQSDGQFQSTLDFYTMDDDSPYASLSLGDETILDMAYADGVFWLVGQYNLFTVSEQGELLGQFNFDDYYLKSFTLAGDGFAVLQLGKYRASTDTQLFVVDEAGTLLSALNFDTQVLDIDAAGQYISILTYSQLTIYTSDLLLYAQLEETGGADQAVLRDDGTAYLVQGETAQLYIPTT